MIEHLQPMLKKLRTTTKVLFLHFCVCATIADSENVKETYDDGETQSGVCNLFVSPKCHSQTHCKYTKYFVNFGTSL